MFSQEMEKTVAELTAPTKGILAADKNSGTIAKRFKSINVESIEESRRSYRESLFTAPGLSDYISGVILFEETLQQKNTAGIPLPQVLADQGIVPIVEPEILMDGSHSIARCASVTEEALETVFHALHRHHVQLECILLKPNMVLPGKDCPQQASPEEIAAATLICFRRTVPAAVPGIVFLSGGQSDEVATANLNAMNTAAQKQPWQLSFSYGRALQAPALKAWHGVAANKVAGQQALLKRARLNSAPRQGKYKASMEAN